MNLTNYISICDAIVALMHPLVEIVIHEIKSDTILYLNGALSQRKVGDPSLLETDSLKTANQIIYPKINFDGKLIKSISVSLDDKWLLCINCDISLFSKMQDLSQALLQNGMNTQPKALFANDWQEKLHMSIHTYLHDKHLSFDHLSNADKKMLVNHLFNLGAFQEKKAADYVAKSLNLSRATIFNHLKELRIS